MTHAQTMPEHLKAGKFTAFVIQVRTNASFMFGGLTEWTVLKRYTDFIDMRTQLLPIMTRPPLSELPARDWSGRFAPEIVEHRRWRFQQFLDEVLQHVPDATALPVVFRAWLAPSIDCAPSGAASKSGGLQETSMATDSVPSSLRFAPLVPYPARLAALAKHLASLGPDETITMTQAVALSARVAQVNPAHRVQVAQQLLPRVRDREGRAFLLCQGLSPHLAAVIREMAAHN